MKEKFLRLRHSLGLALRIIFAIALITVIIVKFKDLQNIDVRLILDKVASPVAKFGTVLGIYAVKGLTLVVPASLIYIVVGMSIELWQALIANILGIVIEVSITYLLGVILGGPFVVKKIKGLKYGKKIFDVYEKHDKAGIFIMRILGLPIDFCSLFLGAMRARFLPYLGMSVAGILPRVTLFTILGDKVYNLIPMKYVVAVGAVAIVIALVVWIVRYLLKSIKSEEDYGKPEYTPLCEEKRAVILDTDIGPDCDDAGALAIMLQYLEKYDIELLGICNCTSNIYGNAAIKAICEYYGLDEPDVACHKGEPMLPDNSKYSKEICAKYCLYESSACAALDAKEFYAEALSKAADNSVTIITIGTFTNVSDAISADSNLFNKKVHSIVSMAGEYPGGKEFNIKTDPISAANVLQKFRNIMVFSGYEVGRKILTGFETEQESNPVCDCYKLHCGGDAPYMNPSYDLTAVQYAFEGNGDFYALSKPVDVTVDMNGEMSTKKNKYSHIHFILKKADDEDIASYLNEMLRRGHEAEAAV